MGTQTLIKVQQLHFVEHFVEKIWKWYTSIEFKEVGIKNPYLVKESFRTDKSKYYHFQKSHIYNTNDCIHQKDAI